MADLARVFAGPAPDEAIRGFITAFAGFWAADRPVMRRLRALAALDPDVGAVIAARDQRRREGIIVLVSRLPQGTGPAAEQAVQVLYALTSFETFDTLARAGPRPRRRGPARRPAHRRRPDRADTRTPRLNMAIVAP